MSGGFTPSRDNGGVGGDGTGVAGATPFVDLSTDLDVITDIKTSPGFLYQLSVAHDNEKDVLVKLYDATAASSPTEPVQAYLLPKGASGAAAQGAGTWEKPLEFLVAISYEVDFFDGTAGGGANVLANGSFS